MNKEYMNSTFNMNMSYNANRIVQMNPEARKYMKNDRKKNSITVEVFGIVYQQYLTKEQGN
jgi:hypothetical protein